MSFKSDKQRKRVMALVSKKIGLKPKEIASHHCDNWAGKVQKRLPGSVVMNCPEHFFIKYKKKYYDAQALNGVSSPDKLPFLKRLGKKILFKKTKTIFDYEEKNEIGNPKIRNL